MMEVSTTACLICGEDNGLKHPCRCNSRRKINIAVKQDVAKDLERKMGFTDKQYEKIDKLVMNAYNDGHKAGKKSSDQLMLDMDKQMKIQARELRRAKSTLIWKCHEQGGKCTRYYDDKGCHLCVDTLVHNDEKFNEEGEMI